MLVSRKLAIKKTQHLVKMLEKFEKTLGLLMKNTPRVSTQHVSVCPLNTPPRVRPKHPCVCRRHAHMLKHVCAWCRYTRARFELTSILGRIIRRIRELTRTRTSKRLRVCSTILKIDIGKIITFLGEIGVNQ